MTDGSETGDVSTIATTIAKWCEDKADRLGSEASRQFRLIVIVVLIGLALLLILPPLIGQIDFMTAKLFGGSPPIEALENAEDAVTRLAEEVDASRERQSGLDSQLEELHRRLTAHADRRTDLIGQAADVLSEPFAHWRRQETEPGTGVSFAGLAPGPNGRLLAVGSEILELEDRMVVFEESREGGWNRTTPVEGNSISALMTALATTPEGGMIAAGVDLEDALLILQSESGLTWSLNYVDDDISDPLYGTIYAFGYLEDGTVLAVGDAENAEFEYEAVIVTSVDGQTWTTTRPADSDGRTLLGALSDITLAPSGQIIAVGTERSGSDLRMVVLRSTDGRSWTVTRPQDSEGKPTAGALFAVTTAPDGTLIAAGQTGTGNESRMAFLRSADGTSWEAEVPTNAEGEPLQGNVNDLLVGPGGELFASASERGSAVLLHSADGMSWSAVRPYDSEGRRLAGSIIDMAIGRDGDLYGAGEVIWQIPLERRTEGEWSSWPRGGSWNDQPELVEEAFSKTYEYLTRFGDGFPQDVAEILDAVEVARSEWNLDLESELRLAEIRRDANAALASQKDTLRQVQGGVEQLSKALTDADELRRASRIATRIAVVALLIYLVQIIVNRYRFLLRSEGFYRGRAQAMRILAASPESAERMLKSVSVTDLMATLSPDGIGFDKSADPPTQNMLNMFRESLRRDGR